MHSSPGTRARFCLVVPCYNEEEMLPSFFEAVMPQLETATNGSWRLTCVDDGSQDATFALIAKQHLSDPRVVGVRLSRNFGHQAAVSTGLAFASGDYVGVIDCDLQDPIEVLVALYRKAIGEGLDVCYGVRARREAPLLLRMAYPLFYWLIARLSQHHWPRDAGDFCVMSARCHKVLLSLPEHSRMLRGLRSWVGFKQAGLAYDRPERFRGSSKYGLFKLTALAMQGLIAFSIVPLRLASLTGLLMGGASVLFGILVIGNRFFRQFTIFGYWVGLNPGVTTILCFLSLIASILFVSVGITGEYLGVLVEEVKRRPTAVVESVLGAVEKNSLSDNVVYVSADTPEQGGAQGDV